MCAYIIGIQLTACDHFRNATGYVPCLSFLDKSSVLIILANSCTSPSNTHSCSGYVDCGSSAITTPPAIVFPRNVVQWSTTAVPTYSVLCHCFYGLHNISPRTQRFMFTGKHIKKKCIISVIRTFKIDKKINK